MNEWDQHAPITIHYCVCTSDTFSLSGGFQWEMGRSGVWDVKSQWPGAPVTQRPIAKPLCRVTQASASSGCRHSAPAPRGASWGNTCHLCIFSASHSYALGTCPVKMRGSGAHGVVGSAFQPQPADEVTLRRNVLFDRESNYQQLQVETCHVTKCVWQACPCFRWCWRVLPKHRIWGIKHICTYFFKVVDQTFEQWTMVRS